LGEETNPRLTTTSFQVVVEKDNFKGASFPSEITGPRSPKERTTKPTGKRAGTADSQGAAAAGWSGSGRWWDCLRAAAQRVLGSRSRERENETGT